MEGILSKSIVGKSISKKFKRLIWQFKEIYPVKQDKFDTRKMIKEACYDIGREY